MPSELFGAKLIHIEKLAHWLSALADDVAATTPMRMTFELDEERVRHSNMYSLRMGGGDWPELAVGDDAVATAVSVAAMVQDYWGYDLRGWPKCPKHGDEMTAEAVTGLPKWICRLDPKFSLTFGELANAAS